ncbi:MAG: hypothetical protein AAGA99_05660 [Actinomycetota bacterium]
MISRAMGSLRGLPGLYVRVLGAAVIPLFVISLFVDEEGIEDWPVEILLGIVLFAGVMIWVRSRRSRTGDVLTATSGEGGRVLVLRAFQNDDHLLSAFAPWGYVVWMLVRQPIGCLRSYWLLFLGRVTWDQALERAVRHIGPVIAIGEPGDRFPTIGQLNEYLPEGADWQGRVLELIGESDLVVLKAGLGDGVLWEVGAVLEHADPAATLVYVGERSRRLKHRLPSEREDFYREFRDETGHLFPVELPTELDGAHFLGFDANWCPVVVRRAATHPREIVRIVRYMESVS